MPLTPQAFESIKDELLIQLDKLNPVLDQLDVLVDNAPTWFVLLSIVGYTASIIAAITPNTVDNRIVNKFQRYIKMIANLLGFNFWFAKNAGPLDITKLK